MRNRLTDYPMPYMTGIDARDEEIERLKAELVVMEYHNERLQIELEVERDYGGSAWVPFISGVVCGGLAMAAIWSAW